MGLWCNTATAARASESWWWGNSCINKQVRPHQGITKEWLKGDIYNNNTKHSVICSISVENDLQTSKSRFGFIEQSAFGYLSLKQVTVLYVLNSVISDVFPRAQAARAWADLTSYKTGCVITYSTERKMQRTNNSTTIYAWLSSSGFTRSSADIMQPLFVWAVVVI